MIYCYKIVFANKKKIPHTLHMNNVTYVYELLISVVLKINISTVDDPDEDPDEEGQYYNKYKYTFS